MLILSNPSRCCWQGVKAARLQTARELAYKRVKSKLLKGRIKNRIEQIKKGVDDLSKARGSLQDLQTRDFFPPRAAGSKCCICQQDEMKDYLIEAGAQTNGEKKQLAGRLKQAWKKQPELKIKAVRWPIIIPFTTVLVAASEGTYSNCCLQKQVRSPF